MCDKPVDNYTQVLKFVSDQYKTQEMCIKAVNNYPITQTVPDCYKIWEMYVRAVSA